MRDFVFDAACPFGARGIEDEISQKHGKITHYEGNLEFRKFVDLRIENAFGRSVTSPNQLNIRFNFKKIAKCYSILEQVVATFFIRKTTFILAPFLSSKIIRHQLEINHTFEKHGNFSRKSHILLESSKVTSVQVERFTYKI